MASRPVTLCPAPGGLDCCSRSPASASLRDSVFVTCHGHVSSTSSSVRPTKSPSKWLQGKHPRRSPIVRPHPHRASKHLYAQVMEIFFLLHLHLQRRL